MPVNLGRILFVLWNKDEIPITELARNTMLSKSTLTSMLDRLEKTGYIIRKRSEQDRRTILIKRAEKDKRLESKYVQVSEEMTHLFYDGFTTAEIKEFENKLKRLLLNLARYESKHKKTS